jgi:hypothetical protein
MKTGDLVKIKSVMRGCTFLIVNEHDYVTSGAPGPGPTVDDVYMVIGTRGIIRSPGSRSLVFLCNTSTGAIGILWDSEVVEL